MKILILSASPQRDLIVDTILAEELHKRGHETSIRPCLREGRQALEEQVNNILNGKNGFVPDVVVTPPIRNPYSRDMVETLKHYGLGIVSRHTEPSCDWKDYKKIPLEKKHEIHGQYAYYVDAELVWSKDEAEILSQRPGAKFPVFACGAFTVDSYKRPDLIKSHRNREKFCRDRKLDPEKKILVIYSPWGFADSAPDLHIEPLDTARKDVEGRDGHFEMIRYLVKKDIQKEWNLIVTAHPGVIQDPYKELCDELKIYFDTETSSFDLKVNADGMIHAGSTAAIGAHFLKIPAWQYGDVNAKDDKSWWGDPDSDISKVSPYFKEPKDLFKAIKNAKPGSNANIETIKSLEKGRYGLMDGKATERAANIISKTQGKFTFRWPKSTRDYSQLRIRQNEATILTRMNCGICKEPFVIVNESYLGQVVNRFGNSVINEIKNIEGINIDEITEILKKSTSQLMSFEHGTACPHCAARFFIREQPV